jgi:hypothetical protein
MARAGQDQLPSQLDPGGPLFGTAALHDGHRKPVGPGAAKPPRGQQNPKARVHLPTLVDRFATFRLRPAAFLEILGFVKRTILPIQLRECICLGGVDREMR